MNNQYNQSDNRKQDVERRECEEKLRGINLIKQREDESRRRIRENLRKQNQTNLYQQRRAEDLRRSDDCLIIS